MAEYIKREDAGKAANEWVSEACKEPVMRVSRLFDKLKQVPTVDAVPVVRCKECKWTGGDFVCYRGVMVQHKPEDFCSYGERRGGGEDD